MRMNEGYTLNRTIYTVFDYGIGDSDKGTLPKVFVPLSLTFML